MAVYKVPQDVEAEDKLLGPFSFRQFVYLIIAGAAAFIGWLMWNISPFLVLIPAPIVVFFVILALPLRKDQPMEIYLIALVQFLLKPKQRLWDPDGIISLVQITLPKVTEVQRTKDLSQSEAIDRLSYLADVMDTRGWAARGVDRPAMNQSMTANVAAEAETVQDVMDSSAPVSQSIGTLIQQQDEARRQDMMARMQQAAQSTPSAPAPTTKIPGNPYDAFLHSSTPSEPTESAQAAENEETKVTFNPYPTAIRQHVIQPLSSQRESRETPTAKAGLSQPQQPAAPPRPTTHKKSASEIEVSPDIINLANNPDLSISTIAREAQRINQRDENEVEIPLR